MLHQHTKKIIAAVCSFMLLLSTLVSAQTIPTQEDAQQTSSHEIRTMSDRTLLLSAGNSFASATPLTPTGNLPSVSTSDKFTKVGDAHYYKIKSSKPYDVSFYLGNFPTNQTYDLDVYNEYNQDEPLVSGKLTSNGRAKMTSLVIAADVTYYIKVSGDRPETSNPSYDGYLLELDYVAVDEYEPNDGQVGWAYDATDITLAKKETKVISATLHDSDDLDIFELTLSEACDVAVTLQSPSGKDYTLQFDREQIPSGQTKSFTASAGESHRMVVHNGGSGGSVSATYTLTIVTKAVKNNTEDRAYAIALDQSKYEVANGSGAYSHIAKDDPIDYYKVTFTKDAVVDVAFYKSAAGEEYETVMYKGSEAYPVSYSGTEKKKLRVKVSEGDTYFFKTTSKSGKYDPQNVNYNISIDAYNFNGNQHNSDKAHAVDMSNDLKQTNTYELDATIFGNWAGFENRYEEDWYKLTCDKNAELEVNVSCYSSKNQYTVILYDATGTTQLKTAEKVVTDKRGAAVITYSIEANKTYYVCVTSNEIGELDNPYTIEVKVTPAATPTHHPNNTIRTAIDVSSEPNNTSELDIDSALFNETDEEWYKFYITGSPDIRFFTAMYFLESTDCDMELYQANGSIIPRENGSYAGYSDPYLLSPGRWYYIRIYLPSGSASANKKYYLHGVFGDNIDDFEINDTMETAYDFGRVTADFRPSAYASLHTQDIDYYKVASDEAGTVEFWIGNYQSYEDITMTVYDEDGNKYTQYTNSSNKQSSLSIKLPAIAEEIFYIKVTGSSSHYDLEISLSSPAPAPTIIFDNTFENGDSSAWKDTTGRGAKAIKQDEAGNSYLEMTCTGDEYYNFRCLDNNISGKIVFETDIKFTENDMELQMRDIINNGAQGFTMAARIKKYAYYIQYFSDGSYQKLLTPSGSWLQLKDVSKWYTLKMELDTDTNTQSIYLSERDTGTVVGLVENISLNNPVDKINSIALSSTDTLCIDNARLTLPSSF